MKKYIVMTTGYVHPYVSGEFDSFESAKAFAEAGNNAISVTALMLGFMFTN